MHAQALNTYWRENLNNNNRFEHFLGNNRIGMLVTIACKVFSDPGQVLTALWMILGFINANLILILPLSANPQKE